MAEYIAMKLFISYAHDDKAIIKEWIVDKLVAGSHDVWFDDRLVAGQDWKQQLSDEIERSDALVYCMTPEAVASDWCQWELARAVDLGKPVIPVLMQTRTQLPDQLKKLQYVDFSDGPTGDAVARLMGGLQNLSRAQIPPAPSDPKGKPAQAIEQSETIAPKPSGNNVSERKSPSTELISLFLTFVGTLAAVIALAPVFFGNISGGPTQQPEQPTPSTPVVVALRDLDIRSGPGADFSRIGTLARDDSLDILGITEDTLWYQVLMLDGRFGWVLASENYGRFYGSRTVLVVVSPTATRTSTPSDTPTATPSFTATSTPTETVSPSPTPQPTETSTQTAIPTATPTASATDTEQPSDTPTATSSPTLTYTYTATATNTFTLVPTRTATPTPSVTATLTQRPSSTRIPDTITPSPTNTMTVSVNYLCEARTVTVTGRVINAVRVRPSANAPLIEPVESNAVVFILGVSDDGDWYQMLYGSPQREGWVQQQHLVMPNNCP